MLRRSSRKRSTKNSASNTKSASDPLAHALRPVVESLEQRQMLTVTPAGSLDSTFNATGSVTTDFGASQNDDASAILVQSGTSTKYIVVGTNNSTHMVELARYNRDGTLDTSFGSGGKVTTMLSGFQGANAAAFAMGGDILVAGSINGATTGQDFVLVRYRADGTLKNTWGNNGSVTIDFQGKADVANAIAVQPSGQIIVSGYATVGTRRELAVALVSDAGSVVGTPAAFSIGASGNSQGNGIAMNSDGSFAVAGQNTTLGNVQSAVIMKFNADGTVDHNFGSSGIAQNTFGGNADGTAIAVDPMSGNYYLAGSAQGDFLLARYTSTGILDTSFNTATGGYTLTAVGSDGSQAYSVAIQPNGKIDVAGTASAAGGIDEFGVVRVNTDGTLDSAFGNSGVSEQTFGTNQDADARSVVFDDQKIVVAGFSATGAGGTDDFALERLVANNAPTGSDTSLTTIDENQTNSPGDSVSSIVAGMGITDADGDAVGIAITGIDNTNGTWQYSTNSGSTWTAISATPNSALLLDQSTGNRVRFVPNAGFTGNVTLTVRPWDKTQTSNDTTDSDTNNLNAFGAAQSATETVGAAPATVYVNSTWSGSAQGATVTDSLGHTHTFGIDAFSTVADGVFFVAGGGTVNVDGGASGLTYAEDVVISHSEILTGYGATTPTLTAPNTASNGLIVSVQAPNVTVEHLNFVVDQPHAAAAVAAIDPTNGPSVFNGLNVSNNVISTTQTGPAGGAIQLPAFYNTPNKYSAGIAVIAAAGGSAPTVTIDNNQIQGTLGTTVGRGIWANQVQGHFDNNSIEAVAYQDALLAFSRGPTTFDGNTLLGTGLTITEPNGGASIDVSGNQFTPAFGVDDGAIVIRHDYNASAPINIHDNNFTMLSNTIGVLSTQSIGVTVNHNNFTTANGATNAAAVELDTQGPSSSEPPPFVSASIAVTNNSFSAAGASDTAILVADHDSGTAGAGNDFGAISVSGNTFDKSLADFIQLAPSQAHAVYAEGDSYTALHPAAANVNIDATSNTFGVSSGDVTLTNADYYEIEDKIVDGVDYSGAGLVRIKANNVFVTPNSFNAPAGTTTPSIQRGVDVASAGDTVNVEAGSYSISGLNLAKAITVSGAFAGTPGTDNSRGTGETILNGPSDQSIGAFTLSTTDPVTITGIEFNGSHVFSAEPGDSDISLTDNVFNLQAMSAPSQANMIFSNPKAITLTDNHFTTTGFNPANSAVLQVAGNYAGPGDTNDVMNVTGNTFTGVGDFSDPNPTNGQSTLQLNFSDVQGTVQNNTFDGVDIGILIANNTGNLTVDGNTFENITRGASEITNGSFGAGIAIYNPNFDQGTVTISNNTFENSDTGIRTSTDGSGPYTLNSPDLAVSGNNFTGNVYNVVDKFAGEVALAGDNVLDGTTLSSATTSDLYAVENKIVDALDVGGYGLVRLKANNIYESTGNYFAPGGTTAPSIQRAVNAASDGDTVNVQAGTFNGPVAIVNKNITLDGAGQGQTTIVATNSLPAQADGKNAVVFVNGTGTNLTIENLTVDGAGLGNGYGDNFVGVDFYNASGTLDSTTVKDVRNTPLDGLQGGLDVLAHDTDNLSRTINITNDTVSGYQKNGITVKGAGLTANISGNTVTGAGDTTQNGQNGIELASGATGSITGNTVSGNEYSGPAGGQDQFNDTQATGILVFQAGSGVTVSGNTVDGNDIGIYNLSTGATITNNQLGNTTANRYEGIVEDQGSSTIQGNTINGGNLGIDIVGYDGNTAGSSAAVTGNTVTGANVGIEVIRQSTGDPATSATITGNTLTNNTTGADVTNATLTVSTGNTITGGVTGLSLNGSTAALTGNTLGDLSFSGQSGKYVALGNGADSGQSLDATGVTFGSIPPTDTTLADMYALEDQITDHLDDGTLGYVKLRAGNVYVAHSSETANAGAVQRGVDVAVSGDTVNIQDGTYVGQVEIAKNITLEGQSQAGTIIQASTSLPLSFTTFAANHPVVYIHDANATVEDLTVDGNGKGGGSNNRIVGIGMNNAGGTIDHVTIEHVRQTPLNGVQEGVGILVSDATAHTVNITNDNIFDYQKNGMTLSGAGLVVTVSGNTVTGAGPTNLIAQNGIQVSGGAAATITGNTISGDVYTPQTAASTGILLFQAGATSISNNTIDQTDVGIDLFESAHSDISGDTIGATTPSTFNGISLEDGSATITNETIHGSGAGDAAFGIYSETGDAHDSFATISGGTFTGSSFGVQVEDDNTSDGVHAKASIGGATIHSNAAGSIGVQVNGGIAEVQNSDLTGNTEGVQISNGATADLGDINNTNSTGLGSSAGNNLLTGYTGVSGNYAIDDENTSSQPAVLAQNNNFGKVSANYTGVINNVIKDHSDNASLSSVNFTSPENVAAAPSVVYVNSTWATAGFGNDPDAAGPATSFGYDAFSSIQDAINAVATGGTVYVEGGTVGSPLTYAEDVVISRSMTLSGMGAVKPTLTAPTTVTNGIIVSVQAPNVTVENLNIVVDQPHAAAGIAAIDPVGANPSVFNNLQVLNNVISTTGSGGKLQQDPSYGPTNKYSVGIAVLAGSGGSAPTVTIDGNQIQGTFGTTVGRGIWANQVQGHFDNNSIEAVSFQDALLAFMRGPTTFDGNTLLGTGLTITEPNAGATIDVSGNQFTPAFGVDDGALVIRHDYNASAPINIHDNNFAMLSNTIGVLSTQSIGVTVNHNTFAPVAGAVNTTAVFVDTQGPTSSVPAPDVSVSINVTNNHFNSDAGLNATAIYVADSDSGTNGPGNDFGAVAVTGNAFDKNLADFIVLAPSAAHVTYSGEQWNTLHPGAANVNIDATNNTFGVSSGDVTLTNADYYEIEDKIVDAVDYTGAGLVRIESGHVFVTPNSFNAAAGTSAPSIQRAINAATAGDTINVQDGTYTENVIVNKSVTIEGEDPATLTASSGNVVTITASNVTLENLDITGGNRGVDLQGATDGDTLKNLTISGQTNYAIEVDNAATVTNLDIDSVTASANTTNGVGFNVASNGQVDGLTITNSHFDHNAYGLETQIVSNSTNNTNAFTHVSVSNTTFNNDTQRAIYVEKLNHATFDNITVNNSGTASSASGIDINLKGGSYGDLTIKNSTFSNDGNGVAALTIKGRNDGAYTNNPGTLNGVTLTNDTISSNTATDLDFENLVSNVTLSGVQLNGTAAGLTDSITAPGALSVGDTDFSNTLGVYIGVGSNNNVDATAATFGAVGPTDNTASDLYGVEDKIHDHLDNASVGYVQLRTGNVYVAQSSESPNAGAIQRGIDVASSGDTVHVQSGTYTGSPQITKSLTLAGDGAATTTINLLPDGSPNTAYLAPIYINAPVVTVSGFTVVGNDAVGNGQANTDFYVNSDVQTANITNNVIKVGKSGPGSQGDDGFGIVTNYNEDPNHFIGTLNVTGNTFTTTNSSADRAFYINTGVTQFNFQNNTVTGNFVKRGFTEANNATISGNEIIGTGSSAGLGAFGDTDPTKYGHATFQDNDFQGVSIGVSIVDASDVTIENNTFENDGTGVLIDDSFGPPSGDYTTETIVNNGFETSVTTGVDNETSTTIDASSNWWGTANGPTNANNTSDGTPKGSAVVGPVTFAPWLTQGDQDANAIGFQPVAVDSTPPNAPSTPALAATDDSGVTGDDITNVNTPHLTGTAEAGSTVRIFDGATLIGTGFADSNTGEYDIQVSALADGQHNITAVSVDQSGNTSDPSGTLTLDIDTQSPAPTITDNSTAHVEGTDVVLVGTVNDPAPSAGTPTYLWHVVASNGQTIADATTKDFTFTPVDNGTYTVTYTVTDEAGNVRTATDVITIANVAPSNLNVAVSSPIDENASTSLSGSFTDPGVNDTHTVTIDWGDGTLQNPDVQTINLDAGVTSFSTTHQYLNNNPGNAAYTVSISVADNSNDSTSTTKSVEVDNVAPSNVSVLATSPVNENGSTSLDGSFTDPGTLDTHTVTIDWGDGSQATILNLAAGVTSFNGVSHQYLNNQAANAPYTVSVTVTDSDNATANTSTSVEVDNVAPANLNLTASSPVNENGGTTLSGTFTDPGTLDTHHVVIDWGDGSPTTSFDLAAGVLSFSGKTHQYLNNQANNAPYTVSVTVTDSDNATTNATTSVEVDNVGPSNLNLTPVSPINENGSTTLSGTFTDPGTLDTHHVVIDWGDGSPTTSFDLAAGVLSFSGKTHQYLNNQAANAPYTVSVTVTDSDNASTNATTSVEVDNVAPANLNLTASSPVNENGSTTLSGSFTDPGTLDTHHVVINWGDGSPATALDLAAGQLSFSGITHQYLNNQAGNAPYTVSVTVTDSDNAVTSNTTSVTVNNVGPSALSASAAPSTINENQSTSLSGSFTDPGTLDTHTVVINWGDGSPNTTFGLAAGVTSFSGQTHQYLNNNPSNAPYTVSVTVTDSDGASTNTTTSVTVDDVEPTVALSGSKSDNSNPTPNAAEGSTFTLTLAPVVDPGYAGGDRVQSYFIIWGDGTTQSVPVSSIDQTTGGTVTHVYQDGTVAAGTTSETDEIQVDIIDNEGYHASAGTLGVVVTNVAPTASFSGSNSVPEGSGANVAFFSQHDASPVDQSAGFTYSYDFNNDGIFEVIGSASSSMTVPASFLSQPGTYTIVGRITDKDGGFTDYTHQITVTNVPPSVNTIANATIGQDTTYTQTGSFTDPGNDAPWQVFVNYNYTGSNGNGALVQSGSSKTFNLSHFYDTPGTYTVLVTVIDNQGAQGQKTFTVTVNPTNFQITNFTPNGDGFEATFNRAANTGVLNLYKGPSNTFGSADVTVVGQHVGAVHGSLVWDPTTNTVDFVSTSGALAPDTYTVTFVSGSTAWEDTNGNTLNGGTNDVRTITVNSVGDVVGISSFARGPGQNVNLPADTGVGVPITISDGTGVTAVDFNLFYNPNLLNVSSLLKSATLPGGWSLTTNTSVAGEIQVSLSGTTALGSGPQTILNLIASVPSNIAIGSDAELKISGLRVNENQIASTARNGIEAVAYLGDASGNGHYSTTDASLISNVVVHNTSGFDAYPVIDPIIIGDVTGDGTLSGQDASLVAQASVGMPVSQLPAIPGGGNVLQLTQAASRSVSIPSNVLAYRNGAVSVPINIDDDTGIQGANFQVTFDSTLLSLAANAATNGSLDPSSDWTVVYFSPSPGVLNVGIYSPTGQTLSGGSGSLINVNFNVASNATLGSTPVTIAPQAGGLNEGGIAMTTTNGSVLIDLIPAVTDVVVSGSAWKPAFLTYLQGLNANNVNGYSIPTGANQLLTLPWTNLNQIAITFNQDVTVTQSMLQLVGVNTASYSFGGFSYNSTTHTAVWTLSSVITADKLLIDLSSSVVNANGSHLSGAWTDGTSSYPSGDGQTSSNFIYRFNVLPGDVNQNGVENAGDTGFTQAHQASSTTVNTANYSIFADVDGSGAINAGDTGQVQARQATTLPAGNPVTPAAQNLSSVSVTTTPTASPTTTSTTTTPAVVPTATPLLTPAATPVVAVVNGTSTPTPTPTTATVTTPTTPAVTATTPTATPVVSVGTPVVLAATPTTTPTPTVTKTAVTSTTTKTTSSKVTTSSTKKTTTPAPKGSVFSVLPLGPANVPGILAPTSSAEADKKKGKVF